MRLKRRFDRLDEGEMWIIFTMVLGTLLAALVLSGCASAPRGDAPPRGWESYCQVWVYPPGYLPVLWTCTSGQATDPPRLPCVEVRGSKSWTVTDGGAAEVPTCAECTPTELIKLDPGARCAPGAQVEPPPWEATDGGYAEVTQ